MTKTAKKQSTTRKNYHFRSKFERKLAKELDDAGVKYTYEEYSYEYDEPLRKNRASCADCGGTNLLRTGWYTPDFRLGNGYVFEAKGRFTAADRRKHLAVREAHPELDIKFVFMSDNKLTKRSKTHYSDWCMENGFDFSIGTFKQEWLK